MAYSSVVLAAVPGFVKRHIVAGLKLNPPSILIVLWRSRNQAERSAETFKLKRTDLNAAIIHSAKLCEALLEDMEGALLVHVRTRSQVVDVSLAKSSFGVEHVKHNELVARVPWGRRHKLRRKKELFAVRSTSDMAGMIVIVVDCDKFWRSLAHVA